MNKQPEVAVLLKIKRWHLLNPLASSCLEIMGFSQVGDDRCDPSQKKIAGFLKAGDELLDLSQEQNLPKIARSLAMPDALADLAYKGQAVDGLAIVKALPPTDQQNI